MKTPPDLLASNPQLKASLNNLHGYYQMQKEFLAQQFKSHQSRLEHEEQMLLQQYMRVCEIITPPPLYASVYWCSLGSSGLVSSDKFFFNNADILGIMLFDTVDFSVKFHYTFRVFRTSEISGTYLTIGYILFYPGI